MLMSETWKKYIPKDCILNKNNSKLRLNFKKGKRKEKQKKKIQTTSSGYSPTALLRK